MLKTSTGSSGKLDEKITNTLKEALSRSPEEYGLNRFRWDGVVVVEFLEKTFSILLKPRQKSKLALEMGYVRKRPVSLQGLSIRVKEFRQGLEKILGNGTRKIQKAMAEGVPLFLWTKWDSPHIRNWGQFLALEGAQTQTPVAERGSMLQVG